MLGSPLIPLKVQASQRDQGSCQARVVQMSTHCHWASHTLRCIDFLELIPASPPLKTI